MNVWLLFTGSTEGGEAVAGPFNGIDLDGGCITHSLTGEIVATHGGALERWLYKDVWYEYVTVHAGTLESPWGERGR